MNCPDFETVIEIARDRLIDAAERERCLEHIRKCASCATLLAEERALSRDLRALSADGAAEEIPQRIETALLAAFRRRAAAPPPASAAAIRNRRRMFAVAALALLAFGIGLAGLNGLESLEEWMASSSGREPYGSTTREPPAQGPTGKGGASAPAPEKTPEKSSLPSPPVVAARQPDRPGSASTSKKRRNRTEGTQDSRRPANDGAPHEFVTQFFPIMQGVELIPLEGGQVVRVMMPRSNLIPLGIPFNQERANETIKADVLVSNGLARAIRLVY
jgi:hypothetical protein